ncbi:phosphoglycerate mutase-like protein [Coniophora puteana RWD-64-598 SS2]|uniref:Phosphoglycerate mutase-like protein n=1 Tax=Coniophora puteana (strain RWD-64-598) TaxID=741705 RepID=A0A5M3MLJ6_CONPW|nr:phosphoglycerate mutase-like protein [Coniophora puteana RWD-64-598 SS2]EIW79664.1 phosphoglycerate mutase-like protein [Coniophora puteana RWD-64-598 SS2]
MVNATAHGLIGVVLLARHGDRTEYYQNPLTYNSNQSYITPLGSVQEYELGSYLRSVYLNKSSPSYISNISTDVADINQLYIRSDAGGGNAILNSAYSLLQGLYPGTTASSITLANGTTVTAPLQGYQYIPVESVEQDLIPSLTSWMDCQYFQYHVNRTYDSSQYLEIAQEAQPFLDAVVPYIDGRSNNFTNMWNIYDYINVQSIHNKTYNDALPPTFLEQARYYANQHEYLMFTDSASNAIGEIPIRTLLPELIWSLGNMSANTSPVKLALTELDYKPFISLFNVTNATLGDPSIAGIANYASAAALELSYGSGGEPEISLKFKNGTEDDELRPLTMWGNSSVTLKQFITILDNTTVNSTHNWCFSCNQTILRGCSVYNFSTDPFLNPGSANP